MKKALLCIACLLFITTSFAQQIKRLKISELESYINNSSQPLIVNFWATFCGPCIQELPHIQNAVSKYKKDSVTLLLVSLDLPDYYPQKIQKFINSRKVKSPVVWLDETNADIFCPIISKQWSGSIPATLFVNNRTNYRSFREEQLSYNDVTGEIKKMLK